MSENWSPDSWRGPADPAGPPVTATKQQLTGVRGRRFGVFPPLVFAGEAPPAARRRARRGVAAGKAFLLQGRRPARRALPSSTRTTSAEQCSRLFVCRWR